MITSLVARRFTAVLASAGVAAALTLIPGQADAGVAFNFEAIGEASASFTGSGGGDCNLSSGQDEVDSNPIAFGHGTKHRAVKYSATFTNTLDSGDQVKVKGNLKSSLTLKRQGGGLKSLEVESRGAITISHTTIGSHCQATGAAFGYIPSATFTESKKGSLALSFKTNHPNVVVEFIVVNLKTGNAALELIDVTTALHGTVTAVLKPGRYAVQNSVLGFFAGPFSARSASQSHRSSANVVVNAVFTPKHH